jgi:hypothetical protein
MKDDEMTDRNDGPVEGQDILRRMFIIMPFIGVFGVVGALAIGLIDIPIRSAKPELNTQEIQVQALKIQTSDSLTTTDKIATSVDKLLVEVTLLREQNIQIETEIKRIATLLENQSKSRELKQRK